MGRNHQPLIDTFLRNEIPAWSRRFSESSHPNGYSFHVFKTYSLRALIFLYSYHSQTLNVLLGSLAKSLSPKHCTASFTGIGIYISFLLLPFSFSKYLHIISICSLFLLFPHILFSLHSNRPESTPIIISGLSFILFFVFKFIFLLHRKSSTCWNYKFA